MLIEGEYVFTPSEVRRERGMALVEHEESVAHLKQINAKIRTLAEQIAALGKAYTSISSLGSQAYVEDLFLAQLADCSECLSPEILKGLVVAKRSATKRLENSKKVLNPNLDR